MTIILLIKVFKKNAILNVKLQLNSNQGLLTGQMDCIKSCNSELTSQDVGWGDQDTSYWTNWVRQNEEGEEDEEKDDKQLYSNLMAND